MGQQQPATGTGFGAASQIDVTMHVGGGERPATGPTGVESPRIALYATQVRLLEIVTEYNDRDRVFHEILKLLLGITSAAEVVYFQRDPTGQLTAGQRLKQHWYLAHDAVRRRLGQLCDAACEAKMIEVHSVDLDPRLTAICAPVARPGLRSDAVCVVLVQVDHIEYLTAMAQLVASYLTLWHYRDSSHQSERDAIHAAAMVELLSRIHTCDSLQPACYELVNELQAFLGCQQIAVSFGKQPTGRWRVRAVSGLAEVDPRSELVRTIVDVMHEAVIHNELSVWPPPDHRRQAMLAHEKLAELSDAGCVVSVPLRDTAGQAVGACVLLGSADFAHATSQIDMLRAVAPHLAIALEAVRRQEQGWLTRMAQTFWRQRLTSKSRLIVAALVTAIFVLMLPIPYRISGDVRLQPVMRRVVAAPFPSLLERAAVEPGDVVVAGQVLALLDGRELRAELAGLLAEYERTETERHVALAKHDAAAARQTQLTLERLALRIQLFRERAANLEIKSPIDGVVLSGDLKKAEGIPVTTGQLLFEIGPLDQLLVEVAIPDEDISFVKTASAARLRLTADPFAERHIALHRIHPEAAIVDSENVFLAEALVENTDGHLRPGMRGTAKISGPQRPIIWILLHRPWQYLVHHLSW